MRHLKASFPILRLLRWLFAFVNQMVIFKGKLEAFIKSTSPIILNQYSYQSPLVEKISKTIRFFLKHKQKSICMTPSPSFNFSAGSSTECFEELKHNW